MRQYIEVRTDGYSLQIVNRCDVSVALGLRERVVSLTEKPKQLGLILPGESLWLPVMRPEPGIFCLKPHGWCPCSNCYSRNEGKGDLHGPQRQDCLATAKS